MNTQSGVRFQPVRFLMREHATESKMSRREVFGAVAKTAASGALVPVLQTAPDARGASLAGLAQRAGIVEKG
jgi:hypothetical protein